eukprot:scaffold644_cov353-Prasinococcus_capsulatus_cf.AAC.9
MRLIVRKLAHCLGGTRQSTQISRLTVPAGDGLLVWLGGIQEQWRVKRWGRFVRVAYFERWLAIVCKHSNGRLSSVSGGLATTDSSASFCR